MAASGNNSPQGKKDRREQARETARLEREAQKKRDRRNKVFLQGGIGLGVLVVIAIIALVLVNLNQPGAPGPLNMASQGILFTGKSGAVTPTKTAGAPADGAATPTKLSSKNVAHITTYVDWACPVCKTFESSYATQIAQLVASGSATLEVHPIAILDNNYPGSRYSSRAANAAACVANFAPTKFLDAQTAFYDHQPAEGSSGLTNQAMISLLKNAGIDDPKITSCITKETFKSWVSSMTKKTTSTQSLVNPADGSLGTPTVFVNGKRWDNSTDFPTFIASAVPSLVGSPSPSPSPSN
ncbi:thioredoxin domain-containing protein [Glaciihabitans sp. UYNi722]|uniref:DsbA family protein n=1 Tax=Glaciihabitans sp. UYNi722 TaxID=3156344 RepID=UPI00339A1C75